MDTSSTLEPATIRELARRSDAGIDVALLWDATADEAFVVVVDAERDEHFLVTVGARSALDVFQHPYAYAAPSGGARRVRTAEIGA
jgi:hypothetical protein